MATQWAARGLSLSRGYYVSLVMYDFHFMFGFFIGTRL